MILTESHGLGSIAPESVHAFHVMTKPIGPI
jgi:hypothetical protein